MKNFLKLITTFLLVLGCLWITPDTYQASGTLAVEGHSIEDIRRFVNDHPAKITDATTWQTQPSIVNPYIAGQISAASRTSALNMLNQVRYIAGLPANVTNDDTYEQLSQAAALVNAAISEIAGAPSLSHYPKDEDKPTGMSDALFDLGKSGAAKTNLGFGYSYSGGKYIPNSLPKTIVHGWMEDGDDGEYGNIHSVGHRRWILNPAMTKTGFGAAGNYTAMYSMDGSLGADSSTIKQIAWPAQNMPIEYFTGTDYSFPWSISMGVNVNVSTVNVKLTRKSDNRIWNFSQSSADGYFGVQNNTDQSIISQTGCIIFRPDDITYTSKDEFEVAITGVSTPVTYSVRFFELDGPESITLSESALALTTGTSGNIPMTIVPATTKAINGITCKSSNTSVATVTRTGANLQITANGPGTVTITVLSADETVTNSLVVTVTEPVLTNTPVPTNIPAKRNQTIVGNASYTKTHGNKAFSLNAKLTVGNGKMTYTSSDKKVVTVDSKGKISIKGSGKATITIRAATTATFNGASKNVTITVKPKKVTLSSVKSSAKKQMTIKWKRVATTTGYEIQYSTNKKFKKSVAKKNINKASTISKTYKVKSGKQYFVRVCSYKKVGNQKIYGAWSTVKSVKIK